MGDWVLLRHDLPDGSWHLDWMLELDSNQQLLSFRLDRAVAWPPSGGFMAHRIGDHRRMYLTYEGPVSGERGTVQRMNHGHCELRPEGECLLVGLEGRWFRGTPAEGGKVENVGWRFDPCDPPNPPDQNRAY